MGRISTGRARRGLLLLCATAALACEARALHRAPSGFELERHLARGLVLARPRGYDPIPVRSDEPWRAARWCEGLEAGKGRALRPELTLLELEPAEPAEGARPLSAWLAEHAPAWSLVPGRAQARRGARLGTEHALRLVESRADDEDRRRAAWAFTWAGEGSTYALLGFCAPEDLALESARWLQAARQVRFVEREVPRLDPATEALYARGDLIETELRAKVRAALPAGWRAVDTPHYLVVHELDDPELVRRVCRDVELLRAEYERLFPPLARAPEAAVVRLCASRDAYLRFGGEPSSVGHFNPRTRELVLYDLDGPGKAARDHSQTLLVLYHEAFHQYVQHSTGSLPPHPWFDEGHGDFFSGADTTGGRLRRIGPHPWRVGGARAAVLEGRHVPLGRLIEMEQEDYYSDAQTRYALGWSFVYFLRTAREAQRRSEWARILPEYFEGLQQAFAAEVELLAASGEASREVWDESCRKARAAALARAFAEIDLDELERAWLAFVRVLE